MTEKWPTRRNDSVGWIIPSEEFMRKFDHYKSVIEGGVPPLWPSLSHSWLEESYLPWWKGLIWRLWWWFGKVMGFHREPTPIALPPEKTEWLNDELTPLRPPGLED